MASVFLFFLHQKQVFRELERNLKRFFMGIGVRVSGCYFACDFICFLWFVRQQTLKSST